MLSSYTRDWRFVAPVIGGLCRARFALFASVCDNTPITFHNNSSVAWTVKEVNLNTHTFQADSKLTNIQEGQSIEPNSSLYMKASSDSWTNGEISGEITLTNSDFGDVVFGYEGNPGKYSGNTVPTLVASASDDFCLLEEKPMQIPNGFHLGVNLIHAGSPSSITFNLEN